MADFGTPVAQGVNTVGQGIQTLSGLLGIEQQGLGLQQSRAQIGIAQAQEQQQQIAAQQMTAQRQFWQNLPLDKTLALDGTLDTSKVENMPEFRQAYGSDLPSGLQQLAAIKQNQLTARQTLVNLDQSTREQFQQQVGALSTLPDNPDTRAQVAQTIQAFGSLSPEAQRVAQTYAPIVQHAPPGKLQDALQAVQLQAMSASAQASTQNVQFYNAGNKAIEVNRFLQHGIQNVPSEIIQGLAPGTVIQKDPSGNLIAFNPQNPGRVILLGRGGNVVPQGRGVVSPPAAGSPQTSAAPNIGASVISGQINRENSQANGPGSQQTNSSITQGQTPDGQSYPVVRGFPEPWLAGQVAPQISRNGNYIPPAFTGVGQEQNVQNQAAMDQKMYAAAISSGNRAPLTKNLLNNINTLSNEAVVGPGSQYLADAETVMSQYIPALKGAGDAATKRQLLGKYVSQLIMNTAISNGYGTDEAKHIAEHALPNPESMTPQAIQGAARLVMAQTEIGQAESSFARNYYAANGSSNGFQQAQGWFLQHIDPRMFDSIGLSDQALTRNLNKWFGTNSQAKNEFLKNMQTITSMGGFDYASEPQQ